MTSFWADKRVLVTGGSGFLGRHLVSQLRDRNPKTLSLPGHREADLTIQANVEHMFEQLRPDIVIHLAAKVGGIGANRDNPGSFFYENLLMGLNVIEQARRYEAGKIVLVGTVCSYPKHAEVPFREADLWKGFPEETNAPYGIAKKALLVQLQAYHEQYGTSGIYLLMVNLYGPGDNFDPLSSHVIPALIRKCVIAREAGDQAIEVWGGGTATREFLYVDDAARGILAATEAYDDCKPVNLGSGREISIKDLTDRICEATGFTGEVHWNKSRPDGQPRRMLDTSAARACFGFEATTSFEEGLQKTVDWYLQSRLEPSIQIQDRLVRVSPP